jgi:hypothetical protein
MEWLIGVRFFGKKNTKKIESNLSHEYPIQTFRLDNPHSKYRTFTTEHDVDSIIPLDSFN